MSLKEEIQNNLPEIKNILENNIDKLQYYKLMTNIVQLKVNYFIKYIKRDEMKKVYYGGIVDSIDQKDNGDYVIIFKSNNNLKWNLLLSRVFIFYREKPMTEVRKQQYEKWKKDMEENHTEEYEKWKVEKKMKDAIKKKDPELYKKLYVHIKTSKKNK